MRANGDHSIVQTTKTRVAGFPLHPHPNLHRLPSGSGPKTENRCWQRLLRHPPAASRSMELARALGGGSRPPSSPLSNTPVPRGDTGVATGSPSSATGPMHTWAQQRHNRRTSGSTSEGKLTTAALRPSAEAGLQRLQPREKTGLRVSRAHVITGEHADMHTHGRTTRGQTARKRTLH